MYTLIVGMIISITAAVIYAVILMKISSANITYRNAGICRIIVQVLSVISLFWGAESVIYIVISIIIAVVGLIAEYNEMNAHSEVLVDVNDYLTEKWLTLWYWNIAAIAAIRRELGTKWAVGVVIWQCVLAWIAAFMVRLIGMMTF